MMNRRTLLRTALTGGAALTLPGFAHLGGNLLAKDEEKKDDKAGFTLPPLPYAYDALEPSIDKMTMTIHHDKHHQGYVDKLNAAVKGTEYAGKSIEELLSGVNQIADKKLMGAIRNNGGGHYNHSLFWKMMSPQGGEPTGQLVEALTSTFGSVDGFKKLFKEAGAGRFGSGWAWLIVGKDGKLEVASTPNQDSPVMTNSGTPILGVDVWEHAYYLKYQNKRPDYLDAFMKVINWKYVTEAFNAAKKA